MARIPNIASRGNISQVSARAPQAGQAWQAISDMAKIGVDALRPKAVEQAREAGVKSVVRDENGKLQVETKDVMGGELAAEFNSASHAKYLSRASIDITESLTELAAQHQFNPAGFKDAAEAYVTSITSREGVPTLVREELAAKAEREVSARFNGLYLQSVKRDQSEANVQTKTQRDMLADDYLNLVIGGDVEEAEKVYEELLSLSEFRKEAPYISETDAETEAYLRGVRGAGKAATLTRKLEDLSGATEISDKEREEIQTILDDPDISPNTRQKLYTATQGRLKGIDASALVQDLSDDSYAAKVVRVESGGRADAKAKTSSATGHHQFIKGTWLGLVSRHKPTWAKGLNQKQILALRKDPAKSAEMFEHFRRENQAVLTKAGVPVNDANEYAAHFLGAGGAVEVLSSDPNTPLSDILPASKIKANPHLKGMTVSDFNNWTARKMSMKASDLAARKVVIDQIEDQEVRGLASRALSDQIGILQRQESAVAAEYQQRLASNEDTLTEQEIASDHGLSDAAQKSLISDLRKLRKDEIEVNETIADIENPDFVFDPLKSGDRKRIEKAYASEFDEGTDYITSPEAIARAQAYNRHAGFVPRPFYNSMLTAARSDDPERVAVAMESAAAMQAEQPRAFANYAHQSELEKSLSDYRFYADTNDALGAAQKVIDARQEVPKNVTDAAKKAAEGLKFDDLEAQFDDWWFDSPTFGIEGSDTQELAPDYIKNDMMATYERHFKDAFLETGDTEKSKARAFDTIKRAYGPNLVTGSKRVMKHPPQSYYPAIDGSYDWMSQQVAQEVTDMVFGDDQDVPDQTPWEKMTSIGRVNEGGNSIAPSQIHLVSDDQTARELGKGPSYQVYYMQDGKLERLPQRFYFDPSDLKAKRAAEFQDQRSQMDFESNPAKDYYRNVELYGKEMADRMKREYEEGTDAIPR